MDGICVGPPTRLPDVQHYHSLLLYYQTHWGRSKGGEATRKMRSRTLANGMLLSMITIVSSLYLLHPTLALLSPCPTIRHGPLLSFTVRHPASPPPLFASNDDGHLAISLPARSRRLRSKFRSFFSLFGIRAAHPAPSPANGTRGDESADPSKRSHLHSHSPQQHRKV